MPVIPEVQLSTRKLGRLPDTYVARPVSSHVGEIISSGAGSIGRGLAGIAGTIGQASLDNERRRNEAIMLQIRADDARINREADYLLAQWKDHTRKGIYGDLVKNQDGSLTQIPGINQKKWTDYEGTKDSALSDLAKNQKEWEESEPFKKADDAVINLFKRRAMPYRQAYIEAVNGMHDRNTQAKMIFQRGVMDASDDRDVMMASGADDDSYLVISGQSALRKAARELHPFITDSTALENPNGATPDQIKFSDPQYAELFKKRVDDHFIKYATDRVTYLTQRASRGETLEDGVTTPEAAIDRAYQWIDRLTKETGNKDLIDERTYGRLRTIISDAETSLKFVRRKQATAVFKDTMSILDKKYPVPDSGDLQATEQYNKRMAFEIEQRVLGNPVIKRYDPHSVEIAHALINSYNVKAGWSEKAITQNHNLEEVNRALSLGVAIGPNGDLVQMNSQRVIDLADGLLVKGEIDHKGWRSIVNRAQDMVPNESVEIATEVLPQVVKERYWKEMRLKASDNGTLSLTPSTAQYGSKVQDTLTYSTLDEEGKRIEKEETVTVNKILDVVNAHIQEGRRTGKSKEQIINGIKDAVSENVKHLKYLSIQQHVNNQYGTAAAYDRYIFIDEGNQFSVRSPMLRNRGKSKREEKKEGDRNGRE